MTRCLSSLVALAITVSSALSAQTPTIERLRITPAVRTVAVGDSLRLTVQPVDARGNAVTGAIVRFNAQGGRFQGAVDSLGWVRAGSPGTIPVAITAMLPGGRPIVEKIEVRIIAGPTTRVVVTPRVTKMLAGQRLRLAATALSATNDAREDAITWTTSNASVARVADGIVTAVAPGSAVITARAASGANVEARTSLQVIPSAGVTATITPDRVRARQGDVVRFALTVKDARGQTITGLTPAWTFSPGQGSIDEEGAFVGNVPGTYVVSAALGAHTLDATVTLGARDVRRTASVVGRLPRTAFYTSEVWVHPDGKHAYLGTTLGGDRIYAIDISDPAKPVITDSIVANSRSMNDVMTTEDGKWMVFTREGAADRKNGIVIASTADPAHPKPVSEFTDGVTAGVHSAFVYTHPKHGTHVYLTNSGTGSLDIIDINDPMKPKRVADYRPRETRAGRSLHDIDVKDGIAYVSYWSDGLIILDVGNGMKGGTPSSPKLISNYATTPSRCIRERRRTMDRDSSAARTPPGGTRTTCSSRTRCSHPSRHRARGTWQRSVRTAGCR